MEASGPGASVRTTAASAVLTSLCVHTALLVVFAAIKWGILPDVPTETISADFSNLDSESVVVELPKLEPASDAEAGGEAGGEAAVSEPVDEIASLLPVEPDITEATAETRSAEPATPEVKAVAQTAVLGSGTTTGVGDGAGQGGAFFDVTAEGDRVVYVVDCSKSMNRPYPSDDRTRFARVKRELLTSIQALRPEQRFFVIYFNTEAHPMPARRLVARDSYDLTSYLRWLAAFPTDGKTDPEPALLFALSLRPDAVFFLTDGVFRTAVVDHVVRANRFRTPIHAIGFGIDMDARAEQVTEVLGGLAERTGGKFALISDDGTVVRD